MLRVIQHAAFLLTPRSASANIAAAYRIPSILWVPNDGANWQLDYPGWDYKLVAVRSPRLADRLAKEMIALHNKINSVGRQTAQDTDSIRIVDLPKEAVRSEYPGRIER